MSQTQKISNNKKGRLIFLKQKLLFSAGLLSAMLMIPLVASTSHNKTIASAAEIPIISLDKSKKLKVHPDKAILKVLNEQSGEITSLTLREFTYGTVAGEMPMSFEPEALRAQAVAALTYMINAKDKQDKDPNPNLKGADFIMNSTKWLYYITDEQRRERWGENYEANMKKLQNAVDPVLGQVLTQDGKCVKTYFHAMSSGNTEDVVHVFGGTDSFLRSVPSPEDLDVPTYLSRKEFTLEELKNLAKEKWPEIKFGKNSSELIVITKRTPTGMVLEAKIGS